MNETFTGNRFVRMNEWTLFDWRHFIWQFFFNWLLILIVFEILNDFCETHFNALDSIITSLSKNRRRHLVNQRNTKITLNPICSVWYSYVSLHWYVCALTWASNLRLNMDLMRFSIFVLAFILSVPSRRWRRKLSVRKNDFSACL